MNDNGIFLCPTCHEILGKLKKNLDENKSHDYFDIRVAGIRMYYEVISILKEYGVKLDE